MCSKDATCSPRCGACIWRTIIARLQPPGPYVRPQSPELQWDPNSWGLRNGISCGCQSPRERCRYNVDLCSTCFELSESELARVRWGWEGTLDVPVRCSECNNITTAEEAQWYCPSCTDPCIKAVHLAPDNEVVTAS